jgi:hypothetical protein
MQLREPARKGNPTSSESYRGHMRQFFFVLNFLFVCFSAFSQEALLTEREKELISHVQISLQNGEKEISKLTKKALKIPGMSSAKVRHFLNNLCSLPRANYLEIGCWKGSTWIAALFENESQISSAVAIDNWSEFGGPQHSFQKNCSKFLPDFGYRCFSGNCFEMDLRSIFSQPVNIYFYDGNHSALSQELAFTYYNDILDDAFIAVIDDWNWAEVQLGTRNAFEKLHYEVLFERALPAKPEGGDKKQWWNGLYVAVIRRSKIY